MNDVQDGRSRCRVVLNRIRPVAPDIWSHREHAGVNINGVRPQTILHLIGAFFSGGIDKIEVGHVA
jgi:hypothetical protein